MLAITGEMEAFRARNLIRCKHALRVNYRFWSVEANLPNIDMVQRKRRPDRCRPPKFRLIAHASRLYREYFQAFLRVPAIVLADSGLKGVQPRVGKRWQIRGAIQASLFVA